LGGLILRIKISRSKNSESYFLIKDIYRNGKRTTKVVEALGNREEIQQKYPDMDPLEWAKSYAKKRTKEEKTENAKIIAAYHPNKQIPKGTQRSFNIGYLFLQSIYHQLKLHKICQSISEKYDFSFDLNMILSRLIYMRVLHPTSKKGTLERAKELLEPHSIETQHIYRALDVLADESDMIETSVYRNSHNLVDRNTSILYYDCTNFYFETEESGGLKQYGMSKEHRPNPIVQMGLFMDGSGLPLAFVTNPGNQNEQPTLKPLEKRILKDFKLSQFVVCTDAGLSSHENRLYNSMGNRAYVTTQSIKKLKKHLKEWALEPTGWTSTEHAGGKKKTINLLDLDMENDQHTYYKERWIHENGLEQRLVVIFSPKYKRYHQSIREKQIERALKKMDKPTQLGKKRANDPARFIHSVHITPDGEVAEKVSYTLNQNLIQEEAIYDGFYGVCTNLEGPAEEVVKINQRRWEIEETFRILKSEMRSRPVFVRKDNRIKAHFLTCFLSLLVYRILEKQLDEAFSCPSIIQTLKEMRVLEYAGEGYIPTYTRTDLTDRLHEVFGFRTDTEIIDQKRMKKILKQTKK
jgi:transposase